MTTYLIAYLSTALVFLIIDAIWLGIVATSFYAKALGDLMLEKPKLGVAAVFYLFYAVGLVFFCVMPALQAENYLIALGYGALFGLCCYGTYDMTNYATLKNWPLHMSIVDMAWGTTISAVSATAGYFLTLYITNFLS